MYFCNILAELKKFKVTPCNKSVYTKCAQLYMYNLIAVIVIASIQSDLSFMINLLKTSHNYTSLTNYKDGIFIYFIKLELYSDFTMGGVITRGVQKVTINCYWCCQVLILISYKFITSLHVMDHRVYSLYISHFLCIVQLKMLLNAKLMLLFGFQTQNMFVYAKTHCQCLIGATVDSKDFILGYSWQ